MVAQAPGRAFETGVPTCSPLFRRAVELEVFHDARRARSPFEVVGQSMAAVEAVLGQVCWLQILRQRTLPAPVRIFPT